MCCAVSKVIMILLPLVALALYFHTSGLVANRATSYVATSSLVDLAGNNGDRRTQM